MVNVGIPKLIRIRWGEGHSHPFSDITWMLAEWAMKAIYLNKNLSLHGSSDLCLEGFTLWHLMSQ